MNLPSKELLSEVLNVNDINLVIYNIDFPNTIEYTQYASVARGVRSTEINIYELIHKCKEWAFDQDYTIRTAKWDKDYYEVKILGHYLTTKKKLIKATTEPEAIFKACEWILAQKDKE